MQSAETLRPSRGRMREASLQSEWVMAELRKTFTPDFSQWQEHEQFEAAFARLLKELRAEEGAK